MGPIIHPAQSAAQVFLLVSAQRAFFFFEDFFFGEVDYAIDQLKPSLKSMGAVFILLFKEHTTCFHFAYYTQGRAEAHKHAKYIKSKGLQRKRIL